MTDLQPITFAITLPADDLSPTGRTLAALYILHYLHRALLSPVMLAPKRAPVHLVVVLSAMIFNVM
jgi:3-oxo-5-alpha-steroid 4-dehydrogenase 1